MTITTSHSLLSPLRRKLTAGLLTLGILGGLGAGTAHAAKGPEGKRAGKGKVERICKRLECSDDQREQIGAILKDSKGQNKAKGEQMQQLKAQLAAEYRKARPNEAEMRRIYAQMDALRAEKRDAKHKTAMRIHQVLTPDQREKVARAIEKKGINALLGKGHGKQGKKGKKGKKGKQGKQGKQGKKGKKGNPANAR